MLVQKIRNVLQQNIQNKILKKLFKLISEETYADAARNVDNNLFVNIKHNFKDTFFPSTIIEWNNLDPTLRDSKSFGVCKNSTHKFIRPCPSIVFNCDNYKGYLSHNCG